MELIPISRAVLTDAARIRAEGRFRVADAIHLATARLGHADVVLTNDERWKTFSDIPVALLSAAAAKAERANDARAP